jgi:hypothetical protein
MSALPQVPWADLRAHWQPLPCPSAAAPLSPQRCIDLGTLAARWQYQLLPGHGESIPGDGSCLLSSVGFLLYTGPDGKRFWPGMQGPWNQMRPQIVSGLRQHLCEWLHGREELPMPFGQLSALRHNADESWEQMLVRFSLPSEFLEAPAVQALASLSGYDISILVDSLQTWHTFYADTNSMPAPGGRMLLLANWALSHFVPLVPAYDERQLAGSSSQVQEKVLLSVAEQDVQSLYQLFDDWIKAYYVEWDQPGLDTTELIRSAQQDADDTLREARLRLHAVKDEVRLVVVGAMRAGKSTLLSALVGGGQPLFPTFHANESCTMVPVEIGASSLPHAKLFTVRVQMASLDAWRQKQLKLVRALFAQWQVDAGDEMAGAESSPAAGAAALAAGRTMDVSMDEFEAELMEDIAAGDAAMASNVHEEVEQPRTKQQLLEGWIRASRTENTNVENHPLKSLYATLDRSPTSHAGPHSPSMHHAEELLASLSIDRSILNAPPEMHSSQALVDNLLHTADGNARFFEFHVADLADVHLLLFLLSVDHAAAEMQAELHGTRRSATQQLLRHLHTCRPAQMAALAPLLRFLVPDQHDAIADLWPLVESIEVNCPWSHWPTQLPKRLRVIDTAGLRSVRTQDGGVAVDKAQLAQLRVTRVWYACTASAGGGGDMMPAVEAMLRHVAECSLPVDVIVTRADETKLTTEQQQRKEKAIKDKINELQPRIQLPAAVPGECFHVSVGAPDGKGTGVDKLTAHLTLVQDKTLTAAKNALSLAGVQRSKLLRVAEGQTKLNAQETQAVTRQLDLICEQSRGSLEQSLLWKQRGFAQVQELQRTIDSAACPSDAVVSSLARLFSMGCIKSHDYRRLGAWVRDPSGTGSPSLAALILDTYFANYSQLSASLDPFLSAASSSLQTDTQSLFDFALTDVVTLLAHELDGHPMLSTLLAVLQSEHVKAHIRFNLEQALYEAQQSLEMHVREVSASAAAAIEQHLELEIARGAGGSLAGWTPTFALCGGGIKQKLLNHVSQYLTGPLKSELLRQCGVAFHRHVGGFVSHIATARQLLLETLYRHVKQALSAVWQPLSKARTEEAKADLMLIFRWSRPAWAGPKDKQELHFIRAQLLKPFQPPVQAAREPVFLARSVQWKWEAELVHVLVAGDNTDRVLLFRGLCGLSASVQDQFDRAGTGPFSPLFVPPQHMYCSEWDHVSALVVILHAYRIARQLPRPLQTDQLLAVMRSDDGRQAMQLLAKQIRQCLLAHTTGASAALPPRSHPNNDFPGQWVNWWTEGTRPKDQHFTELKLALQQTYTNDDKGFMQQFQLYLTKVNLGDPAFQSAVVHRGNWRIAAKLVAWQWLRHVLSKEECLFLSQYPGLHVNPNVSMSKRLQHAMRYVVGLKKYAQGTTEGRSPPLDYGRRAVPAAGALYFNPAVAVEEQRCYQSPRVGQLLGGIVVHAVPSAELQSPFTADVIRQYEEGTLWPEAHARHESEVCQFGFANGRLLRHDLLVLNWDDANLQQLQNAQLDQRLIDGFAAYGFTPVNVSSRLSQITELRKRLRLCVSHSAAAALSERYSDAEVPVREYLGTLAFAALHSAVLSRVAVRPSSNFVVEEVIKGTIDA